MESSGLQEVSVDTATDPVAEHWVKFWDGEHFECSTKERWIRFKDGHGCQIGTVACIPFSSTTIQLEKKEVIEIAIAALKHYFCQDGENANLKEALEDAWEEMHDC